MEHINKQEEQKAHDLIGAFLRRCHDGGWNTQDLYESMSSDRDPDVQDAETTFNKLRRLLLYGSGGRCCYCMKTIDEDHTTLEHIIPNKVANQEAYDEYKKFYTNAEWNKIVFAPSFLEHPRWPNTAYPHTVAYENLVPSCNGKFADTRTAEQIANHVPDTRESKCCNNRRGSKYVIPFILKEEMVKQFEYRRDGFVFWSVPDNIQGEKRKELLKQHKETIDHLQLNCPELVAIRRIWCFLASQGKNCSEQEKDRTILYLTEDNSLSCAEHNMLNNFFQSNYWGLLKDYEYFNDIHKFIV